MGFNFTPENLIHANVVSFAIMVAIFAFFIKKMNVGDSLEQTKQKIIQNIDLSVQTKEKTEDALMTIKDELHDMPHVAARMEKEAKHNAQIISHKIEDETQKQIKKISENTQKSIAAETLLTKLSLSKNVSLASLALAKENLAKALDTDIDLHKKIINECIDDLDRLKI